VIRSFGEEFCKMSPRVISEAALKKKAIAKKVVGSSKKSGFQEQQVDKYQEK
jgi:hypothetical protein